MNEQEQKEDRAAAFSKAQEAAEPYHTALLHARAVFSQARADMDRLDAECDKVWGDTYGAELKARREA